LLAKHLLVTDEQSGIDLVTVDAERISIESFAVVGSAELQMLMTRQITVKARLSTLQNCMYRLQLSLDRLIRADETAAQRTVTSRAGRTRFATEVFTKNAMHFEFCAGRRRLETEVMSARALI
jgi:hypothetical protein